MSSFSDGEAVVKRNVVLDLLACEEAAKAGNRESAVSFAVYACIGACRLTDAGVNWEHRVRSKHYRGKLGELYDRTKPYRPTNMREV